MTAPAQSELFELEHAESTVKRSGDSSKKNASGDGPLCLCRHQRRSLIPTTTIE